VEDRAALTASVDDDPKRSEAGLKSRSAVRPGVILSSPLHDPLREGRMAIHIQRREFILSLSSMAAWPLVARAQPADRMRRIGLLMNRAADNSEGQDRIAAFHQGLQELGWSVGRNVRIDTRWGEDNAERERKYAAELVALSPDVILASGTLSVAALQTVSRTLPIVFAGVTDPVGAGFVNSLARPGGNATGFMIYELQYEREMAGASQANRAERDASGCHSEFR
jgi:ABC transporter substrate binding protein